MKFSITSLVITLIILELFVRLALNPAERPNIYFDLNNKIVKYSSDIKQGTYTIGLSSSIKGDWKINRQGWNSTVDFNVKSEKKRIAIIGDSFVEGFQVNVNDRFSELLRASVKDSIEVLEFGRAGAPLSQYLHMARYVTKTYNPDILVINVVANDFPQSLENIDPSNYFLHLSVKEDIIKESEIHPYPIDKTKSIWKKSALVRYLYYNARLGLLYRSWRKGSLGIQGMKKARKTIDNHRDEIEKATEYIVNALKKENKNTRIIFLIDAPRPCIYSKSPDNCDETILFNFLKESCKTHSIETIDFGKIMRSDYIKNKKRFEFKNDLHWNKYGHKIVYKELLKQL